MNRRTGTCALKGDLVDRVVPDHADPLLDLNRMDEGTSKRLVSAVCRTCGAGIGLVSCVAMILATLSAFGISVTAGLAQVNVPFSRPLLVLSLLLMVLGLTLKGLAPGILTVIGGMFVFLGMFELPLQTSRMTGMGSNSGTDLALPTFWLGVALIVAAYIFAYRPRTARRPSA